MSPRRPPGSLVGRVSVLGEDLAPRITGGTPEGALNPLPSVPQFPRLDSRSGDSTYARWPAGLHRWSCSCSRCCLVIVTAAPPWQWRGAELVLRSRIPLRWPRPPGYQRCRFAGRPGKATQTRRGGPRGRGSSSSVGDAVHTDVGDTLLAQ